MSGRPPRPIQVNNSLSQSVGEILNSQTNGSDLSKTAPASLPTTTSSLVHQAGFHPETLRPLIPPSPPPGARTRPNNRGGWNSVERIMSGSMRLSRASTTTSLASDYLDGYMQSDNFGGSLGNIDNLNSNLTNGFGNERGVLTNNLNSSANASHYAKPLPPPRISSSNSANNQRITVGRAQETQMLTASCEPPSSMVPPPIKVVYIINALGKNLSTDLF